MTTCQIMFVGVFAVCAKGLVKLTPGWVYIQAKRLVLPPPIFTNIFEGFSWFFKVCSWVYYLPQDCKINIESLLLSYNFGTELASWYENENICMKATRNSIQKLHKLPGQPTHIPNTQYKISAFSLISSTTLLEKSFFTVVAAICLCVQYTNK